MQRVCVPYQSLRRAGTTCTGRRAACCCCSRSPAGSSGARHSVARRAWPRQSVAASPLCLESYVHAEFFSRFSGFAKRLVSGRFGPTRTHISMMMSGLLKRISNTRRTLERALTKTCRDFFRETLRRVLAKTKRDSKSSASGLARPRLVLRRHPCQRPRVENSATFCSTRAGCARVGILDHDGGVLEGKPRRERRECALEPFFWPQIAMCWGKLRPVIYREFAPV